MGIVGVDVLKGEKSMIKEIIDGIVEKYYHESEEYYGEYRYDENDKEFNMGKELEEALTEKGVKFIIKKEDDFLLADMTMIFLLLHT